MGLALFFIYKGVDKIPIKIKSITQEEIVETIIEKGSYEAPGFGTNTNVIVVAATNQLQVWGVLFCGTRHIKFFGCGGV